ncbi:hypothetical protein LEP1GSC058_3337 [Leptospira fainei serovar Hurstbridge str. BUT 6]|uniref:Uncharacterized protein n=1 Tax=Leptospira fainei serovar Hurstbridge str. BUT 6 TaxID=1193011 RepID=S3UWC4_9LEPT|nr:hypothetical protein LEP1GSC058_3337 [Leptospira fainei serovar Hurstbridge str. BUT 6]
MSIGKPQVYSGFSNPPFERSRFGGTGTNILEFIGFLINKDRSNSGPSRIHNFVHKRKILFLDKI